MKKMRRRNFFGASAGSLVSLKNLFNSEKLPNAFDKKTHRSMDDTGVIVKIMGTAQDGGIPQLGCDCKNCSRGRKDQKHSRLISSLAILDFKGKKFFLVDATPDIRIQSEKAGDRLRQETFVQVKIPHGVLLTHAHIGHYTGLMYFGYESLSTHKMPVYCSARMRDFLMKNGPWNQLIEKENIFPIVLSPNEKLSLAPRISVVPFQVPHRDEYSDTLGFIISGSRKSLLYLPDIQNWEAWDRSIIEEVEKVDVALLDGTFYSPEELPGRDLSRIGHPFIKKSMETLNEVPKKGKTTIYFTHLNHSNFVLDPEGEARKNVMASGFRIAADGLEISL